MEKSLFQNSACFGQIHGKTDQKPVFSPESKEVGQSWLVFQKLMFWNTLRIYPYLYTGWF
jgi:hypothetical protein